MKGDLGDAFEKLKQEMFVKYKGCLIEIKGGEFYWSGIGFKTIDLAKEHIDHTFSSVEDTITK